MKTLKDVALEYGKGWEFRIFDADEIFLFEKTTDEILNSEDAVLELEVKNMEESKIYIHVAYIFLNRKENKND